MLFSTKIFWRGIVCQPCVRASLLGSMGDIWKGVICNDNSNCTMSHSTISSQVVHHVNANFPPAGDSYGTCLSPKSTVIFHQQQEAPNRTDQEVQWSNKEMTTQKGPTGSFVCCHFCILKLLPLRITDILPHSLFCKISCNLSGFNPAQLQAHSKLPYTAVINSSELNFD